MSPVLPRILPRSRNNMRRIVQLVASYARGEDRTLMPFCGQGILSDSGLDAPSTDDAPRICPRCTKAKPLSEFGQRTKRGKKYPLPYCRPCHVEYHKEWRHGKGLETFRAANAASKRRYPNRKRARDIALAALHSGEIKWGRCVIGTDCSGRTEMHHDDYDKPLEITWVCRGHHRTLDRARKAREMAA